MPKPPRRLYLATQNCYKRQFERDTAPAWRMTAIRLEWWWLRDTVEISVVLLRDGASVPSAKEGVCHSERIRGWRLVPRHSARVVGLESRCAGASARRCWTALVTEGADLRARPTKWYCQWEYPKYSRRRIGTNSARQCCRSRPQLLSSR